VARVATERPIAHAAATPPAAVQRAAPSRCAAGVPEAACTAAGIHVCSAGDRDRTGEWRYALIAGPFAPTLNVTLDPLRAAWRGGTVAAAPETEAALAPTLGAHAPRARLAAGERPTVDAEHWAIVPAHELIPSWNVITVNDQHPITDGDGDGDGPLVV